MHGWAIIKSGAIISCRSQKSVSGPDSRLNAFGCLTLIRRCFCASSDGNLLDDEAADLRGQWAASPAPSSRVWLGNISATATVKSVRSVFAPYGPLTDAAVFPARVGPLGYAVSAPAKYATLPYLAPHYVAIMLLHSELMMRSAFQIMYCCRGHA